MSQQNQQPQTQVGQPSYQAQTQAGQAGQESQFGQFVGQQYQQSVPAEVQQAVADLERFETVCEWLTIRASNRGMIHLADRSNDLASVAHLQKKLILRQSPFAQPIGQAARDTIKQGIQDFQQYAGDPDVQEALTHAQQTLSTINQALNRIQTVGQQHVEGYQEMGTEQPMKQPAGQAPQGLQPQQMPQAQGAKQPQAPQVQHPQQ